MNKFCELIGNIVFMPVICFIWYEDGRWKLLIVFDSPLKFSWNVGPPPPFPWHDDCWWMQMQIQENLEDGQNLKMSSGNWDDGAVPKNALLCSSEAVNVRSMVASMLLWSFREAVWLGWFTSWSWNVVMLLLLRMMTAPLTFVDLSRSVEKK